MSAERMASPTQTVWEATAEYWRNRTYHPISGDATRVATACKEKHQAVAMGGPIHGCLIQMKPDRHTVHVAARHDPIWTSEAQDFTRPAVDRTTYELAFLTDGRPVMVWEHLTGTPDARTTEGETP